jgi:hypothetical protein
MQRYTFQSNHPAQYLGGVGKYDVFYVPSMEKVYAKRSSEAGDAFVYNLAVREWQRGYLIQRGDEPPTDEECAVILAMYECFAVKS